jgi:hypothetical protein
MVKRMNKKGALLQDFGSYGILILIFLAIIAIAIFLVWNYFRDVGGAITPGLVSSVITGCEGNVNTNFPSSFCNEPKKVGDNNFVTCGYLTQNPGKYAATFTPEQESSFESFNKEHCKEEGVIKTAIINKCQKDFIANMKKVLINGKACSFWASSRFYIKDEEEDGAKVITCEICYENLDASTGDLVKCDTSMTHKFDTLTLCEESEEFAKSKCVAHGRVLSLENNDTLCKGNSTIIAGTYGAPKYAGKKVCCEKLENYTHGIK